jgi:hypothetical protein
MEQGLNNCSSPGIIQLGKKGPDIIKISRPFLCSKHMINRGLQYIRQITQEVELLSILAKNLSSTNNAYFIWMYLNYMNYFS